MSLSETTNQLIIVIIITIIDNSYKAIRGRVAKRRLFSAKAAAAADGYGFDGPRGGEDAICAGWRTGHMKGGRQRLGCDPHPPLGALVWTIRICWWRSARHFSPPLLLQDHSVSRSFFLLACPLRCACRPLQLETFASIKKVTKHTRQAADSNSCGLKLVRE